MRCLVVTGSSGGHIFPAVSLIQALKDKDPSVDILFVLPDQARNIPFTLGPLCRIKYLCITALKLQLDFKNFRAILKLAKGSFRSLFILIEYRPDIVVSFGGIGSVPLVLFAWIFRIKTLIHEQNVIPGRANKLLSRFVDRLAISFEQTKKYLAIIPQKIVLTGNPLRRELKLVEPLEAFKFFGFTESKFTVLVVGGSQGSHRINEYFLKAASLITNKLGIQIIHIAGNFDYDWLEKEYRDLGLDVKVKPFFDKMEYAYSISDLAICRAGATTIAELIKFKLPAVLIPYPFAYQHQLANAKVLADRGSAVIIEDDKLEKQPLAQLLDDFMKNPGKIERMRYGYADMVVAGADQLLAKEVFSLGLKE